MMLPAAPPEGLTASGQAARDGPPHRSASDPPIDIRNTAPSATSSGAVLSPTQHRHRGVCGRRGHQRLVASEPRGVAREAQPSGGDDAGVDDVTKDQCHASGLPYDPSNPAALRDEIEKVEQNAPALDPRVRYRDAIQVERIPRWVNRWNNLRLFVNRDIGFSLDTSTLSNALAHAQHELRAAQQLLADVTVDGGARVPAAAERSEGRYTPPESRCSSPSAATVTATGDRTSSFALNAATPFWRCPESAAGAVRAVVSSLERRCAVLERTARDALVAPYDEDLRALTDADASGVDGTQRAPLAPAVQVVHAALLTRSLLAEAWEDDGAGEAKDANASRVGSRTATIRRALSADTPVIHSSFVVNRDIDPVFDDGALLGVDSLDGPEHLLSVAGEDGATGRRAYSIHISFIRLRAVATAVRPVGRTASLSPKRYSRGSPDSTLSGRSGPTRSRSTAARYQRDYASSWAFVHFTPVQRLVSVLLDAYEQYKLLQTNQMPGGLMGRQFYEEKLINLERQPELPADLRRRMQLMREVYRKTCELERLYMRTMVTAWASIQQLGGVDLRRLAATLTNGNHSPAARGVDGAAAGGGGGGAASSAGSGQNTRGSSPGGVVPPATAVRVAALRFSLRRVADESGGVLRDSLRSTDFPLASSGTLGSLRGAATGDAMDLLSYVPVIEDVAPDPPPELAGQELQVLVFARTSKALPPQYVGCTAPRTMDGTLTLHFNETFELRTVNDPTELLLHLVPANETTNVVLASVQVPPVLQPSALLLPLQAPIAFTYGKRMLSSRKGGSVPGTAAVTTTWTSHDGLSVHDVERIFLRGERDPLDPRSAPLLNMLRTYYHNSAKNHVLRRRATGGSPRKLRRPSPATGCAVNVKRVGDGSSGVSRDSPAAAGYARPFLGREGVNELSKSRAAAEGVLGQPAKPLLTKRQEMLRRRWLMEHGRSVARSEEESLLMGTRIPLSDEDAAAVQRRHAKQVARHNAALAETSDFQFTITKYDPATPASTAILGLALSPLPKEVKRRLWRERQRIIQLMRSAGHKPTDAELLGKYVTLPQLLAGSTLNLTPESGLNPRRERGLREQEINREELAEKDDSRIVIHVMKATNLPRRADGTQLEPFIQATFVAETAYTRTETGSSPAWFQTLSLPFQPLDFDDETLSVIDDSITLSLYDKVQIALPKSEVTAGAVAHETHYRTERRLLGTLHIPFFTLHQAEEVRMEGLFHFNTPRWLMGYEMAAVQRPISGGDGEVAGDILHAIASPHTAQLNPSIQVYVALLPPLRRKKPKETDRGDLVRAVASVAVAKELHFLHSVVFKWMSRTKSRTSALAAVNAVAKHREIKPFVLCATGDLTLICRYILPRGGPPPATVRTVNEAVRFVSLLPFIIDTITWNEKRVWSTNVETLASRSADYEELALLLVHFLRYLAPGEETYALIGSGNIHHHMVVVLHSVKDRCAWQLIDPRTGWVTDVGDPNTVLRDVFVVFSHDQLWSNAQLSGSPHRMKWDLHDDRFWQPCFHHDDKATRDALLFMAPIQREILAFSPPLETRVADIEREVRLAVKCALQKWRHDVKPVFHESLSDRLRALLEAAEEERCAFASVRQGVVTDRARELLASLTGTPLRHHSAPGEGEPSNAADEGTVHLVGSPVNLAFNELDEGYAQLLQLVYETAVHEVGSDKVTFALGVYAKGYTSAVYSMWVLLIAMPE